MSRKNKWIIICLALVLVSVIFETHRQLHSLKKRHATKYRAYKQFQQFCTTLAYSSNPRSMLPIELQGLPSAEEDELIVGIKNVDVRGVEAPYNASIIENGDGYLLFFRYDLPKTKGFTSCIGSLELDRQFNQVGDCQRIHTGSEYSEDPRVFKWQDQLVLTYNDLMPHECFCRTMRLAPVDLKTSKTSYMTEFDLHIQPLEKNWMPFTFINEKGESEIYFEYSINPHKILKVSDPKVAELTHLTFPNNPCLREIKWFWGTSLRGGTPARLVDGEYLAFFHSPMKDKNGIFWYVMGAYTFEAKPPFRLTGVSRYPILFNGLYDSPIRNTADPFKRTIFPSGMVIENRGDKQLLHVSCGENDSAVKIITFDKDALVKSLRRLDVKN